MIKTLALLTGLMLTLGDALGAKELRYAPAAALSLEGESTLHPYRSSATVLALDLAVDAEGEQGLAEAIAAGRPARLTLRVPVDGLRSGSRKLDANMLKALKAGAHPEIMFRLLGYQGGAEPDTLSLSGELNVAGVSRAVKVDAALRREGRTLRVEGRKELLMSDFGIEPPKMFMGALRTDDRVLIRFRVELEQGGR